MKVLLQVGFDALMLVGRLSVGKLQIGVREKYNVSQADFTKRLNKHYINCEMNWISVDCFTNMTVEVGLVWKDRMNPKSRE